jgi:hypothetical protein
MRWQTREKIDWEYRGTAQTADDFLPKKEPETLTEIQIAAMKEEIRNEAAKAISRSLENAQEADEYKRVFAGCCQDYEQGKIAHWHLLELFRATLTKLNGLHIN